MLKFLRKNQKWLLAVFCVVLMVAFLIPQAAQQFSPDPSKQTLGKVYGDQTITRDQLVRVSGDLQMMRRLGLDPVVWPGLALIPNTGKEQDDALHWALIQRAADHNNLGASQQEAFNLIATLINAQDETSLEAEANKIGVNGAYLLNLGVQYLKAEQYRQLVMGTEFQKPEGASPIASPGLQRLFAAADLRAAIEPQIQQIQQQAEMFGMQPEMLLREFMMSVLSSDPAARITGHTMVSDNQVRYLLQRQLTELDLTVVLLDADDRLATVTVSDEDIKATFERYADDAAGTGQPYGLGYREPDRVKLEALRIPIDAARQLVDKEIKPDEIITFYNENKAYYDLDNTLEGQAPTPQNGPSAQQRIQIRRTLIEMRAQQKVVDIAQQVRVLLNEDARGLPDDGSFKKLPADFKPTPLVQIAAKIEAEHGINPEVILVDQWTSSAQISESATFTRAWLDNLPGSFVRLPHPQYGVLMEQPLPAVVLGGKAGLFATFAPELSNPQMGQLVGLANYIGFAKELLSDLKSPVATLGLQVGLPGRVLIDNTRSTYVFRITGIDPSHPATDLTPIADQVRTDTQKIKAYEQLAEEKAALIERAATSTIERLMVDADAKKTLTGVTRSMLGRPDAMPIEGLNSTAPILEQAVAIADQITAAGLDSADEADRLFVVELPGQYKLAVVRLDAIRPLSQAEYRKNAASPMVLTVASRLNMPMDAANPMSLESLIKATGYTWAKDAEPSSDEDEAADEEAQ